MIKLYVIYNDHNGLYYSGFCNVTNKPQFCGSPSRAANFLYEEQAKHVRNNIDFNLKITYYELQLSK